MHFLGHGDHLSLAGAGGETQQVTELGEGLHRRFRLAAADEGGDRIERVVQKMRLELRSQHLQLGVVELILESRILQCQGGGSPLAASRRLGGEHRGGDGKEAGEKETVEEPLEGGATEGSHHQLAQWLLEQPDLQQAAHRQVDQRQHGSPADVGRQHRQPVLAAPGNAADKKEDARGDQDPGGGFEQAGAQHVPAIAGLAAAQ